MEEKMNYKLIKTVFSMFNPAAYDFYLGTFLFVFVLRVLLNDAFSYVYTVSVTEE